jgi:hypothetical protein
MTFLTLRGAAQGCMNDLVVTPCEVVLWQLADERSQLRWNSWPSRARLPAPEQLEPLTMPTEKGCRLHHS